MLKKILLSTTFALAGLAAAAPAAIDNAAPSDEVTIARRGADDGIGHGRRGRGADDPAGHNRKGRGTDDGVGHA